MTVAELIAALDETDVALLACAADHTRPLPRGASPVISRDHFRGLHTRMRRLAELGLVEPLANETLRTHTTPAGDLLLVRLKDAANAL